MSLKEQFRKDAGKGLENIKQDKASFKRKLDKIGDYLWNNDIDPGQALNVIKQSYSVNLEDTRVNWKMHRFDMYLNARLDEKRKLGNLGKKVDTIRRLVGTPLFEKNWKKYSKMGGAMNQDKEVKKLVHLVGDPRQSGYFKAMFFKGLSQGTIDEIK